MSLAITHFAFGAAATMLALAFFLPRVPYSRTLSVLGGVWAMIPDAYHVAPAFGEFFEGLHASAYVNLFWAHGVLDALDPGDTNGMAALGVVVLLVATVIAESVGYYLGRSGRRRDPTRALGRGVRDPPALVRVVRLLAGTLAAVGGLGLHAFVLPLTPEYAELTAGLGALLELLGAATVAEDPGVAAWTSRHVPSWLSLGATAGAVVAACLLAAPLLLALSEPSAPSVVDAAVGALLVLAATRLPR